MITPTIHLNGTSKAALLEGYLDVLAAGRDLREALCKAAPHGRDYYPQGSQAYTDAATDHTARLRKLNEIIKEIEVIATAVSDQGRA